VDEREAEARNIGSEDRAAPEMPGRRARNHRTEGGVLEYRLDRRRRVAAAERGKHYQDGRGTQQM